MNLTVDDVLSVLRYIEETGAFVRTKGMGGRHAGSVAGSLDRHGHRLIHVFGRRIAAHRLAWFVSYGKWPSHEIDHINGERDDNRLVNLREATHAENLQNQRRAKSDNKSTGILGAYKSNKRGRWESKIQINGKLKYLGTFESPDAAHEAYVRAKRELHKFCVI